MATRVRTVAACHHPQRPHPSRRRAHLLLPPSSPVRPIRLPSNGNNAFTAVAVRIEIKIVSQIPPDYVCWPGHSV